MTQDRSQGAGTGTTAKLAAMMFLEFFIWGAWSVTVGPYLDAHGMPEAKKWAYSIGPLAAIISPFFLGMVADRFFATERVLALMHFLGGVALLIVPSVAAGGKSAEWIVLGILSLHVLCFMPTLGLTNTLAFHHVTNQEKQFPFIRVLGPIGWIVANNILSWLHWDVKPEQFYLAGGAALLLGFYSLALPHTPPPAAGKKAEARDILGLDALALMRQRSFAVFVICSFLICIPLAAYYQLA